MRIIMMEFEQIQSEMAYEGYSATYSTQFIQLTINKYAKYHDSL